MDIMAPCIVFSLGFGRIGCFLNGCCYGAECDLPKPLSVTFPYGSNAYIEEFETNKLRAPVPREFIQQESELAKYADRQFPPLKVIQEPLPRDIASLATGRALKTREELATEYKGKEQELNELLERYHEHSNA